MNVNMKILFRHFLGPYMVTMGKESVHVQLELLKLEVGLSE